MTLQFPTSTPIGGALADSGSNSAIWLVLSSNLAGPLGDVGTGSDTLVVDTGAPRLVASYFLNTGLVADLTSLVTTSFTPAVGEVIVVKAVAGWTDCIPGTPTGGGLTYAPQITWSTPDPYFRMFTTVTTSASSMTVTIPFTGGSEPHAAVVERWSGAQLASTPATVATSGTGAPSATVSTVAANSVVSWFDADNTTTSGTGRVYQTTSGTPVEEAYFSETTFFSYTFYSAYQPAAASGSQTIGLTTPSQTWRLFGIEIQASATTAAETLADVGVGADTLSKMTPTPTLVQTGSAADSLSISIAGISTTKYAAGYYPIWQPIPRLIDVNQNYRNIIIFEALPVGGANGSGALAWDSWDDTNGSFTNRVADIATCRARGQKIIMGIGGSIGDMNFTSRTKSQTCIDSIKTLATALGGIDGIDWDNYENITPVTAEYVWMGQQLKTPSYFGSSFIIQSAVGPWRSSELASFFSSLISGGAIDYVMPMEYADTIYNQTYILTNAIEGVGAWSTTLGGYEKLVIGFGIDDIDPTNYMTSAEILSTWNAAVAAHPTIGGAACWNIYNDIHQSSGAVNSVATDTMAAVITDTTPSPADAGTGTDQLVVAVSIPLFDAGSAVDSSSITAFASVTLVDAGAAVDGSVTSVTAVLAGSGTASDGLVVAGFASPIVGDVAVAADSLVAATAIPVADVGTGGDSLATAAPVVLVHTAIATDDLRIAVTTVALDAGVGADGLVVVVVSNCGDAGASADTLTVAGTLAPVLLESGQGTGSIGISAVIPSGDAGGVVTSVTVAATVALSGGGIAADALAVAKPAPTTTMAIPAYSNYAATPPNVWTQWADGAPAVSIMIVDTSDGPGTSTDPQTAALIAYAQAKGVRVIGYVDTAFGARSAALVQADLVGWKTLYGITDIFFDQADNTSAQIAYYTARVADVRALTPGAYVMLNSGVDMIEEYISTVAADSICVYEDIHANYASWVPNSWYAGYPASCFVHLIYNCSTSGAMQTDIATAISRNAGHVYVTSDSGANPWDTLPTYWAAEVAALSGGTSVDKTLADTGAASGELAVSVSIAPADTGVSTDTLQVQAPLSLNDAGTGSDALQVQTAKPLGDVGVGSDTLQVQASTSLSDVVAEFDALSVQTSISLGDVGAGSDALQVQTSISLGDVGAGSDALTVTKLVGQSDLAGASDALNISTTVLLVDSASVADALVAGPGNQLSDIGAGSDMLRVSVVKLLGDGASCSDAMAQLLGLQLMPRGIGITTVIIPGSDGTRAVVSGGTLATILGLGSDNTRVVVSGGTSTVVQVSSSQSRAEPQGNRGQSSAVVQ